MTPANGIKAIWTSMCINSQKMNYFTNPPKTDLCVHSEVDYMSELNFTQHLSSL